MRVPPTGVRPTIYDVAAEAGVSKSLVSLVLRGGAGVSKHRRLAVEAAIKKLDYRPSQSAALLARERSMTVGVVLDDYRNLWFVDALIGIQQSLSPEGLRVAVAAEDSYARQVDPSPLDGFLSLRVDGVVIAMEPTETMAVPHHTPVVVVGERDRHVPGAVVVSNDNYAGAELATQHLLDLGHRRIAHISAPEGTARRRREGYLARMTAAGLEPCVATAEGHTSESFAYHTVTQLLRDRPDVTALSTGNDTMALGAVAAVRDAGLRVPFDISVIGYDNSALASSHLLQLTTIDDRSMEVGRQAGRTLLALISGAGASNLLVAPELVLRRSTTHPVA